jgi:thiamine biosynthesis lipoprotein
MGCRTALWVVGADPSAAGERLSAARELVAAVEARLSRFRADSELSRLNANSGAVFVAGDVLWDVVALAVQGAHRTDGLYDPTVIDALETAGYDRPFAELGCDGDVPAPLRRPVATWRDIRLDPATREISLPPGLRLDLGGVAKARVAELAADALAPIGPIAVADPHRAEADLALLLIRDRGVATSGVDYRRWQRGGRAQHHLIDPRTRRPAETDLLSATVVAPRASEANLHALAAMVLGSRAGLTYLTGQSDVEGLLIYADGRRLMTAGFGRYVHTWDPDDYDD